MTRTEERLLDALHASAGRVDDHRLRPLPAPGRDAERRARQQRARRAWLIPAAAAASVVLVIGLVLAVTGGPRPAVEPSRSASPAAGISNQPRYFVRFVQTSKTSGLQVQSVSTGAVTAYVPSPESPPAGTLNIEALAAAPGDRTFYAEYGVVSPNPDVTQTRILTFRITSAGAATPLTMIKGGLLSHQPPGLQTWGNLAVSPDGTRLALTVNSSGNISDTSPAYSDKIIVIDLRTGQRTAWQGGLDRPGQTFSIPDLSWSADGQSLVFLGQWCDGVAAQACDGASGPGGARDAQVWSLSTATRTGGLLSRGRMLLRQSARYPVIAQAYGGPDTQALTVAVLSGQPDKLGEWPQLTVEDVSVATGSPLHIVYRKQVLGAIAPQVWLTADPSGRYLLISYAVPGGYTIGRISDGTFHLLPIPQPYLPNNATLIIAW